MGPLGALLLLSAALSWQAATAQGPPVYPPPPVVASPPPPPPTSIIPITNITAYNGHTYWLLTAPGRVSYSAASALCR